MKTRVALGFPMLLFGLASVADAQLRAGSPEDEAFTKIEAEKNSDAKLALLLEFETKFPSTRPKTLAMIYLLTMDIYSEKDNKPKIAEYGDKAIAKDPDNVSALLRVSRNLLRREDKPCQSGGVCRESQVDHREPCDRQPAPTGQSDEQWKQWLDANAQSADQYAAYAKMLQGISNRLP